MTSQIFSQNASWTPWTRLFLQAGCNFVWSETKTPASNYTQAVLNSQNNYWTVTFDSTVVVDDKTDFNLGFIYYQASDYNNNSSAGLPLGAGADEQTLTASLTRRITQNLRVSLKYAYTHYNDWASGGFNNYDAQMVLLHVAIPLLRNEDSGYPCRRSVDCYENKLESLSIRHLISTL